MMDAEESIDDVVTSLLHVADDLGKAGNKAAVCCLIDLVFVLIARQSCGAVGVGSLNYYAHAIARCGRVAC